MALFQPGHPPSGGRAKGSKNRLSHAFLHALAEDFEQHGVAAIRIMRIERPADYVRCIASLMPRELEITSTQLNEISDDELDIFINYAREKLIERSATISARGGEDQEINGSEVKLLSAVSPAT